ncbi:hypothetical protein NBRC116601_09630 [Cognatishimia sp. WU-CL00825]|uniref:hypothetical protein n=1 Tax=Cognatishimia sp. WU-CL00825 TaxID=3127658 RepID=UPI0031097586
MKQIFTAAAILAITSTHSFAGGMSDPVIPAPVIAESASSSTPSSGAIMALLTISILWAAIDD